jgi:hypothetical protein
LDSHRDLTSVSYFLLQRIINPSDKPCSSLVLLVFQARNDDCDYPAEDILNARLP